MNRLFVLLLVLLIAGAPSAMAVEQPPVRMTLEPVSLRTRTGGPIGLRIKLHYNRQQLLEGDLLLKIFEGRRDFGLLRATCRYDGIVLHGTDANFDVLLPPLADAFDGSFDVEAWFETKTENIPLSAGRIVRDTPDTFNLMSSDPSRRSTILFSVSGRADPRIITSSRDFLHDILSPLALIPQDRQQEITWVPASMSGTDLPENPLQLCSSDLVLITDGALSQLESSQLQALVTWTEAGGSLCLVPTDQGLTGRHLEFVRRLLPQHAERMILTDAGLLQLATGGTPFCAAYTGLGRCVLIPHGVHPGTELSAAHRSWIGRFLWKARGCHYPADGESFADVNRKKLPEPAESQTTGIPGYSGMSMQNMLVAQQSMFGQKCESILMPSDVTMVPTSVIIMLLSAYVLAVGPVDYFVLGLFRLRKYTWIVFPVVTLGFTLTMIAVAHHYLGASDTGKQFVVTDVLADGRPVRSSVIDLQYLGSRREVSNAYQAGLIASAEADLLALTGRFPQDYAASHRIEQWAPDIIRTFTLSPQPIPDLGIDWNDGELVTTEQGRRQLQQQITASIGKRCLNAAVLHRTTTHHLIRSADPMMSRFTAEELQTMRDYGTLDLYHTVWGTAEDGSRARPTGFFRFVGQVSPGGAAALEDVPLLDHINPDQWLLVVLLETDEGYHLIRRLYCLPGASGSAAPSQTIHFQSQ